MRYDKISEINIFKDKRRPVREKQGGVFHDSIRDILRARIEK